MTLTKRVHIIFVYIGLLFFLISSKANCQEGFNPIYSFSLNSLHEKNPSISSFPIESPTGEESIKLKPDEAWQRFKMPGYDDGVPYNSSGYLVIDLEHDNTASLVLSLEFKRIEDTIGRYGLVPPRISVKIGVLPNLPTRMIFPLSYLDAQHIFIPKYPRQLKGTLSGKRMIPQEIDEVYLRLRNANKRSFRQHAFIKGVYLFDELPPLLPPEDKPMVDSLGQWNAKTWKGKSESFEHFREKITETEKSFADSYPDDRSEYLGYKALRFDSTGFFHTHHDGNRWWLVDPAGYAYLSVAPTGVGAFSPGPVEKNEDLFEWLPPNEGLMKKAYASQRGLLSLSFVTVNLIRLWGEDYKVKWQEYTAGLIRSLGFTGSANWSDADFYRGAGLPYFYAMSRLPSTKTKLFRDFPDVYSEEFAASVEIYASQLKPKKDDPLMIGYFLGNEPHWAFGEFNLAREMMYKNDQTHSRLELISWLREKYDNDPFLFSAAWGFEFNDFNELAFFILPKESDISEAAENDLREFTTLMVDKYAATICEATKKVDPNHLNLGLRFAWISSNTCLITGKYFDVFSLNGYKFPDPPETKAVAEGLNMPVLIGEFHFGAIDRGLPATGLKGVRSQKGRGMAYRRYVEQGFARPEIVGLHYFQWNDQPLTGRFDGENYNIGIIDVTSQPYENMGRLIKKTNFRLFDVATGKIKPYRRTPGVIPSIAY